jgi:hypothetical protein
MLTQSPNRIMVLIAPVKNKTMTSRLNGKVVQIVIVAPTVKPDVHPTAE